MCSVMALLLCCNDVRCPRWPRESTALSGVLRSPVRWEGVEVAWSPTGSRWLFVGARVAVGLFVELSVFICYLDLRINWTSSAPNRASHGVLWGRRWCWTTSSGEGRSCGQKEVDSESIMNFSLPFVRIFPWIKGLFWCKMIEYYLRREAAKIALWLVCDHETMFRTMWETMYP